MTYRLSSEVLGDVVFGAWQHVRVADDTTIDLCHEDSRVGGEFG